MITAGSIKIKHMLPDSVKPYYDPKVELDKGGVKDLMASIITHGGKDAGTTISNISKEFFHQATVNGFSTPLADYLNDSEDRAALIKEFSSKIDGVESSDMERSKKDDRINEITHDYEKLLNTQNLSHLLNNGSTAALMAQTGARGNPNQLMQGTSTPLISKRIDKTPIPLPITKSYSEGLTPAQQLAMSYWGRGNTVAAQLATSKPGDMFKQITPNLMREVVITHDCGTSNGIPVKIDDKRGIIGRYEAGTNVLIDEARWSDLKGSKKTVVVRSPMTCTIKDGVCQKCYGLDSRGHLPDIGENVGVIASQSVSEVLTQMVLGTKHDAKAGKKSNPFDLVSNLLTNPQKFLDKATISKVDGTVNDITETSLKDNKVFVNGVEHFVPRTRGLRVSVGDTIRIGDQLSGGTTDPRELVSLRGTGDGRKYISEEMNRIYEDSGNFLDKRHFEIVAKNVIKHVRVKNPGDTDYLSGQVLTVNAIQDALTKDTATVDVKNSIGSKLAQQYLQLTPGTVMDNNHIEYLLNHGVKEVKISKSGLTTEAIVPGLKSVKFYDDNWISKLTLGHQARTLKTGVAEGHSAEISSTDPIAAYIMGRNFGDGADGKY
jgi:DNA-directed RNA polymerase subunit beta'